MTKKVRKKYDHASRTTKLPIRPYEHLENIAYTNNFIKLLDENKQTYRNYEELTLVHRFTFYSKHVDAYDNTMKMREMIEDIYTNTIIPNCNLVDGVYQTNLDKPLYIHHKRRKAIIDFINMHWEAILTITDRREYTKVIYNANLEHKMYLALTKCPIMTFVDNKADMAINEQFRKAAIKFGVLKHD